MSRRRVRRRAALLVVSMALASVAAPAAAQTGPPNPSNSDRTINPGFDDCPGGEVGCPARVILEMYERWRPLNAACDHRAVFALTYLRTTEEFARAAGEPGFFEDLPWVTHEDAVFAQFYFRAFDGSLPGETPAAWRIAFEAASSPDQMGIGDMLLGMNAHINRDLAYTLAAVGLVKPGGGSRKTDHDKVNEFLARVAAPLQAELARRYDPLFDPANTSIDEQFVLDTVEAWREQAWRNAENLVNAPDDSSYALAAGAIEADSESNANLIRGFSTMPGYGPTRDAYCRARLEPSFRVELLDRSLRRAAHRGKLRLLVQTDGPARFTLRAKLLRPHSKRSAAEEAGRRRGRLTPARGFQTPAAGNRRVTLKLTRRARRLLAKRRDQRRNARVLVVLAAPGLSATGVRKLRGR